MASGDTEKCKGRNRDVYETGVAGECIADGGVDGGVDGCVEGRVDGGGIYPDDTAAATNGCFVGAVSAFDAV